MFKFIKLKSKDNFRKVAILLFDILQKHFRNKHYTFTFLLLPHIFSGPKTVIPPQKFALKPCCFF